MKVITISKKRFKELTKIVLSKNVTNTEAKILDLNYNGKEKILKALYYLQGTIFANKLYTIEMLDSNKDYLPSSFLIPDFLCTVSGEVIGFTLPKFEGSNLSDILLSTKIEFKEQIYYLKKIGEILNQLQNIRLYTPLDSIYINDLHESNFLVNLKNRELKVIDLDSCKIGHNKVFPSRYLCKDSILEYSNKYKINNDENFMGYIKPDSNSEIYCYVMVILNYLFKDKVNRLDLNEFYEYLNYLEYIGINKKLVTIFSKIVNNCDNENPYLYLDSIKDEQICRANKIIYNKIKNKVLK